MRTDCAPLLANLFLFYHGCKFTKGKLKQNSQVAKPFSNTFRYIDDLLLKTPCLNKKLATYLQLLELKRTMETDSRLPYLDLDINNRDRKFIMAVFDKRDCFSFHIQCNLDYPDLVYLDPRLSGLAGDQKKLPRMRGRRGQ